MARMRKAGSERLAPIPIPEDQGPTPGGSSTGILQALIAIEPGAQPTSYDFSLMSVAVAGWAPLDQILAQAAEQQHARRARKNSR